MARVKLSEYRAKKIFIGDQYQGIGFKHGEKPELDPNTDYVLKVDQGVKKRGKQGLIAVKVNPAKIPEITSEWAERGYTNYILDPLTPHEDSEEHYVSFERTRSGISISYSSAGGVDIEEATEAVQQFSADSPVEIATKTPLKADFITRVAEAMNREHMSFVEFNPLVIQGDEALMLDAAVLVDSAGEYFANAWSEDDVVEAGKLVEQEKVVKELDHNSPAALKLKVLNTDGSLWLLLSGGGASVSVADTTVAAGMGDELGNYGEYSGGPTADETYLYAKEVLKLAINSKAPKKALIIAGGVANFTDVAKTFAGIIKAIGEVAEDMQKANMRVFVRRGGPNEREGLRLMENFLKENDLLGSIAGSDIVLTDAIDRSIDWLKGEN